MIDLEVIAYALLGGIIPAIFWLKFWLKEEKHMEPRSLITGTFFAGMGMVLIAIPLEKIVGKILPDFSFPSFVMWSVIEEGLKLFAAYMIALKTRFADEPVDAVIYLVTASLGFAALENTLFLLGPFADGDIAKSFATLNLRFIGASLLHVLSSGIIGLALASTFFEKKIIKIIYGILGFSLGVLLHAVFNHLIITSKFGVMVIFAGVWLGVIAVILILEKIKKIKHIQHL